MPARWPTIVATSMGFNRARDPWQPSPIFDYAFGLARAESSPRVCFVSTGTGDQAASIDLFYGAFAETDVRASHLALFDKPNVADVRSHLLGQDVIWVDRGSLVNLLAVWRAHGVDAILRECWEAGVVVGGESAGSLCWFQGGTTDSFGDVAPFTDGLRLLPYSNAVHYEQRRDEFQRAVADGVLPGGYATDAGAGLCFVGTELAEAVADRPNAGAYRVAADGDGAIREEQLEVRRLKR